MIFIRIVKFDCQLKFSRLWSLNGIKFTTTFVHYKNEWFKIPRKGDWAHNLDEYRVKFEDGTEDYINLDDESGIEMILLEKWYHLVSFCRKTLLFSAV